MGVRGGTEDEAEEERPRILNPLNSDEPEGLDRGRGPTPRPAPASVESWWDLFAFRLNINKG